MKLNEEVFLYFNNVFQLLVKFILLSCSLFYYLIIFLFLLMVNKDKYIQDGQKK